MIRVSVVIPNHDYARYLPAALSSILDQTIGPSVEVIVIDDASTDDSWEVLRRYADDPRVRTIRHERNRGYVETYNEGMALARGEHIVSMDADDLAIDPDAFRLQAATLDADPSLGLVFGNFHVVDELGRRITSRRARLPALMRPPSAARRLLLGNFVMHSGAMIRRTCVEELGAYDTGFYHCMDWDLWMRIASRYGVAHIDRYLYAYRVHPHQMHRSVDRDVSLAERARFIDRGSRLLGLRPDSPLRRRAVAMGHLDLALMHAARNEGRAALADIVAAIKISPRAVVGRAGLMSLVHLAAGVVLGSRKSALLERLRRV